MVLQTNYKNITERYEEQVTGNVTLIATWSLIALVAAFGLSLFMAGSWSGVGILALAALACYALGSAFGFLFSIPRSAQNPEKNAAVQAVENEKRVLPQDNSNLEQISDWLVKILIGAGLVELSNVKALLVGTAASLSHCLLTHQHSVPPLNTGGAQSATNAISGLLTSTPPAAGGTASFADVYCTGFCLFFILFFLVLGFLTGYLITRLWLPYVMLRSTMVLLHMQWDADEERAGKEAARKVMQKFGLTGSDAPPVTAETATGATRGEGDALKSDPLKGRFGGKSEDHGLRLSAEVSKMDDIDEDYFQIRLKVSTDGTRSLDQPVTFHLHPTFPQTEVKVVPTNNEALLVRAAWGAFTVGVTVEGEPTQLELDLATLQDAPELFKSR